MNTLFNGSVQAQSRADCLDDTVFSLNGCDLNGQGTNPATQPRSACQ